jgi:voltage-gated potassium channel
MRTDHTQNTNQNQAGAEIGAYELFIFAITILSLLILVIMVLPGIDEDTKQIAFALDTLFSLIFLGDFFWSLYKAPDRRAYLKWGWLDLLGSLPALPQFRVFRVARLVRILRILHRTSPREIWQIYKEHRGESAFWTTALVTLLVLASASLRILHLEEGSPEANILTATDAMWWAIVTVTTVGYGDKTPTTDAGRVMGSGLILVGVVLVSVLTSYITSELYLRAGNEDETAAIDEELARINTRLDEIRRLLEDNRWPAERMSSKRDTSEEPELDRDVEEGQCQV